MTVERFLRYFAVLKGVDPDERVSRLLRACAIEDKRQVALGSLSTGERHLVAFAQS